MEDHKEIIKLYFASGVCLCGLILLSLLVWLPVPHENQPMANLAMGAVITSIIGVPIAFVLGGNPTKKPGENPTVNNADTVNVNQKPE
jgi:glucan phosphoethanolaminetransferase (alkaline phosphatase superfamily)